jgi:SAM-dependent methyltransferase
MMDETTTDSYATWAADYDLFGEIDTINAEERAFLDRTLHACGAASVLDCACGTGQHLLMLSRLGYDVRGSDVSAEMLAVCRANLQRRGVDVETRCCDYRALETVWHQRFGAVVCLTQSLNHMLTHGDLIAALTSMRRCIAPGGVMILTQGTTHRTLQPEYRFDLMVNNRDFSRVFARDIEEHFQTIHVLDVFHSEARMGMQRHDIRIRILLDEEFRDLVREAGFASVSIFGDYDGRPYDRTSSMKLIVVAGT